MTKFISTALALTLLTASALPAPAAPVGGALALRNAAPATTEQVRWRGGGGWRGGRGWGWGLGGFAAGAIIGGALARPYYGYPYGYGYGYGYPAYYPPPVYAAPPVYGGDAVGYCMRRFKSYDPGTGTYLGYDGYRHPCP